MKIKPNRLIKNKLCQTCKNFTSPDCPRNKIAQSISLDIDKHLVGMTVMETQTEITIVDCQKYEREKFLSDYFPVLDKA